MIQPYSVVFKDDGVMPNSRYPLLFYRQVLALEGQDPIALVRSQFALNHWTNSWIDGIYTFHHYHSTSHEVLGICRGSATVRLGGEQGELSQLPSGISGLPTKKRT